MSNLINVSKTEPLIVNTLPTIIEDANNSARFKYFFVNPGKPQTLQLLLKLEYLVLGVNGNTIGSLITQTTYTIAGNYDHRGSLNILYLCFVNEVNWFRKILQDLHLTNYQSQKIITPSFQTVSPVLYDLYPCKATDNV
jgi:hypothetical protein